MFSAATSTGEADTGDDGPSSSHAPDAAGTAAPVVSGWGADFLKVTALLKIAIPCMVCRWDLLYLLALL